MHSELISPRGLVQSTGCLVINNYQVLLYNGLGLYGSLPLLLYAMWDSWAAFMNFMNSLWLDKIGRIPIMVIGQVCYPLMPYMSKCSSEVDRLCHLSSRLHRLRRCLWRHRQQNWQRSWDCISLSLYSTASCSFYQILTCTVVTFFGGSMDASSYVYASELFPTSIRANGAGFSISALFCFSLIYTMCAPVAFTTIGWRYYIIFIVMPLIGAGVMYMFYPEVSYALLLDEDWWFEGRRDWADLFCID